MTKQEKIIVSAYTGILMCDMKDLCEYIQKKFGRPVFDYELADKGMLAEIKKKTKEEFLEICNREEPGRKTGRWIRHIRTDIGPKLNDIIECSECRIAFPTENMFRRSFCPNCGSYNGGKNE